MAVPKTAALPLGDTPAFGKQVDTKTGTMLAEQLNILQSFVKIQAELQV